MLNALRTFHKKSVFSTENLKIMPLPGFEHGLQPFDFARRRNAKSNFANPQGCVIFGANQRCRKSVIFTHIQLDYRGI